MTRKLLFLILTSIGCYQPIEPQDCTISCTSSSDCPDGLMCGSEGLCRKGETDVCLDSGVYVDGRPPDAALDAPTDAFACTTHSQCAQMDPETCCVDPGPMGHCERGIIVGGGTCFPQ